MGKHKQRRQKPHKQSLTLLSDKNFDKEEDEEIKSDSEKVLQNVYSNVQSHNLEEKLSALQILSSMSCNSSVAKQITKDRIAKILGPMLIDNNMIVRSSSASTLKDIAENGEEEACADLIKDDIMTPLVGLFNEYLHWNPKEDQSNKTYMTETFIDAVGLLWVLCANNESALDWANKKELTLFLTKFIDINVYGIKIVTVATQCMVCLSDENTTAVEQIKKMEPILLSLLDLTVVSDATASEILYLKTAVADLLNNLSNCTDSDQMHVLCKIVPVLSEVLDVDLTEILSRLTSVLPHENNISRDKLKRLQESKNILESQEQALQIIANLCFEEGNNSIDSDIDDCEIETEVWSDDDPTNHNEKPSTLAVELVEVMNKYNLIDKVWCKAKFTVDDNSREILDQTTDGRAMLNYFNKIQCTAYLCINNLVSSLEIDAFGDVLTLYKKCSEIGADIFREKKNDAELIEAASAAMRAILQRLVEIQTDVLQLTYKDIEPVVNGISQCHNTNVRVNLIRILSDMVRIAINRKEPEKYKMIKDVTTILLDICENDNLAWVIAESIDALMDIHGEEDTDHVAAEIKFLPRLTHLVSRFKSKVREQKKCLRDHTCVVSTVNANLSRFIRYKERKMRKLRGRSEDD